MAKPKPDQPHKVLSLRLPPDLHAQLTEIAAGQDRSLTQQIIHACRAHVAAYSEQGPTQVRRD